MTIYLLLSLLPLVHSFSSVHRHASFVTVPSARLCVPPLASAAKDNLDQMVSETRQLEIELDKLYNKRDQVIQQINSEISCKYESLLELALATNEARREVELEHKKDADGHIMLALDEVDIAEELLEDTRAVSVEEAAVMVESDALLRSAQEAVYKASMENMYAERSLEQLEKHDQELRALLSDLRSSKLKQS